MRDMLKVSADRLRVQAIVATVLCMLAASTLPGVTYYYVFQHDDAALGPFAWAHWAVVATACGLGILAHRLNNKVLLAMHTIACCMMGAALGGFDTAFWYQLATGCGISQAVFAGCEQCGCAATSSCTATDLKADGQCHSCTAYPREACDSVLQRDQKFILAFTGLAAVVFLAVPAMYSLLVLCRSESSAAVTASKRQMVSFAVDQQTTLIESGDRPTVTPAMLAAWVGFLLESGEQDCAAISNKCRDALASRGFELPVVQRQEPLVGSARHGRGNSRSRSTKHTVHKVQLAVDAASSGGASAPPPPEVYAAAEAGQRRARSVQVAAEERRAVQFTIPR